MGVTGEAVQRKEGEATDNATCNTSPHYYPTHFIPPSLNDLHSTMSCVLSEELVSTPLVAVQVMVAKALSLITLVTLRLLVTLNVVMVSFVELVMTRVAPSSVKGIPSRYQERVGAGTPVAVHISAPEAPSKMFTVGF